MVFSTASAEKPKYDEIPDSEGLPIAIARTHRNIYAVLCRYFTILLIGAGLGFTVGFYSSANYSTALSPPPAPPRPAGSQSIPLGTPIPHDVFGPRIAKNFVPDELYVGGSDEVNAHWEKLLKGHDAIYLENPEQYNLGKGIEAPFSLPDNLPVSEKFYVISNLHQLHCVNAIRKRYWQILKGAYSPDDANAADWIKHIDHCVEYLRLGITCGDFLVVEPDSPPGTPAALSADGLGWGVTHDCINFDRLLEYQSQQINSIIHGCSKKFDGATQKEIKRKG